MNIRFHRTDNRHYRVETIRDDGTRMTSGGPGFSDTLPHDLLHFIVEQELGLRHGIFGQVAAGGTAGTFMPVPSGEANTRQQRRRRRAVQTRGRKLSRQGELDAMRSERAVHYCLYDWLSHSRHAKHRHEALKMKDSVTAQQHRMSTDESRLYTPDALTRVRASIDALSLAWTTTAVGDYLEVTWQD